MGDQTLLSLLYDLTAQTPDRTALIEGLTCERISYRRVCERVDQVARGLLDAGIKPGDNILVFMEGSTELVDIMFAAGRIGATCLPLLGPDHRPSVVDMARQLFKPNLFIFDTASVSYSFWKRPGEDWQRMDELRTSSRRQIDVPMPRPDDTFYYNMSSGTTANSKIVPTTHRQAIANGQACAEIHKYRPDDRHLCTFRGHQHDLYTRALVTGASSVLLPDAQDNVDRLATALVSNGVTCLMGSPMTLSALDAHIGSKLRGSRLRLIECGGGPISEMVKRSLAKKTGASCVSVFGATETAGVAFAPPFGENGPGHSIGVPLPGYHVTLIKDDGTEVADGQPGQLVIAGIAVGKAYTYEPPSDQPTQLKDHVFRSGDLARRHRNGWYEIIGRDANSCKVCGVRVYFERVERAIREATPIRDVAVVPNRQFLVRDVLVALYVDPGRGERINYRRIREGLDDPIFEMPRAFFPVAAIPSNAAGKVDRFASRSLIDHQVGTYPWRERLKWRLALFLLRPKVLWLLCQAAYSKKKIFLFVLKHPATALKILIRACRRLDQS